MEIPSATPTHLDMYMYIYMYIWMKEEQKAHLYDPRSRIIPIPSNWNAAQLENEMNAAISSLTGNAKVSL